jgi:protein gp37
MSQLSGIEWTDATWNPVRGCSMAKGSEAGGCLNCYAAALAARNLPGMRSPTTGKPFAVRRGAGPRWTGAVELIPSLLDWPLRWKGSPAAKAEGRPSRVFVNSMSDLFHEELPFEAIASVFGVMAAAPRHIFQMLTKRPERAVEFFAWVKAQIDDRSGPWSEAAVCTDEALDALPVDRLAQAAAIARAEGTPWPLPNVWLGTSVENQATADARIPLLLQCSAAVRFVSYEPALEPVEFGLLGTRPAAWGYGYGPVADLLHWIIVGGESGPGARPFDVAWARSTVEQCRVAGAACFVKQLGGNVRDRNDVGFFGEAVGGAWPDWPDGDVSRIEHNPNGFREEYQGAPVRIRLCDRKGGDWSEWPADLRLREFPGERAA